MNNRNIAGEVAYKFGDEAFADLSTLDIAKLEKLIIAALDDRDIQWEASIANAPSLDYLLKIVSNNGNKRLGRIIEETE